MKIKNYAFDLHKKAFRIMESKCYRINIPLNITGILLQAIIYIFVCIYVLLGVFGVGSIIKYVGFVETITESITSYFKVFARIKYNNPFVKDYLAYFDIPQKMDKGTLTIPKHNGNEYYIEFRDVSFRYPNTEAYVLRHINIRFKAGEKFAVVGQNDFIGLFLQRGYVRRYHVKTVPDAHDKRRVFARGENAVGHKRSNYAQRKRSPQQPDCARQGGKNVAGTGKFAFQNMGDHFGVGLRDKAYAVFNEFGFQRGEIFDNAVVHDCEVAAV